MSAFPSPAHGQGHEFGFGGGVAVPVYEAAALRGPGPHLFAYAGPREGSRLRLLGEISFAQLGEQPRDPSRGLPVGDLRVLGLGATVAWSPAVGRGVYALAGGGAYAVWSTAEWDRDRDLLVPGIHLGVGADFRVAGQPLFARARVEVPFSSRGSGSEFAPAMYLPFTVGVRLP